MGFCADMVTSNGDINRRLRSIDYNLTHKQTHLDEVNYAVKSLNDLRDGTRITRIVELLFKGEPLSQKLRLPAISKLQKIHNVNLALTRISEHITIEGNISTRDIVNGHREKMLSLFWQLIYKYLTPQYNKAAKTIQHWWRNSNLKLVIIKRIRAKQTFKRHLAATKIQAWVRGYLNRKHWAHKQAELIENREKLHLASTKIKQYLRNKLKLLTEDRKRFIILRRTAVFVQRTFRSKIERKNLPANNNRLRFLEIKRATILIQSRFRANRQVKEYRMLRNNAIVIQRRFRANVAMKQQKIIYEDTRAKIIRLQAFFRGHLVLKKWPQTKYELEASKKQLISSSNTIKKFLRLCLSPTPDRLRYIKLRQSVMNLQARYRAIVAMKSAKREYLLLKDSVIILQRHYRAHKAMLVQKQRYELLKKSTVVLQTHVRGYLDRRRWPQLKYSMEAKHRLAIETLEVSF